MAYLFKTTCLIFGMGLSALVSFLDDFARHMMAESVWIYLNSPSSVATGDPMPTPSRF